jgi:hypothetical protein
VKEVADQIKFVKDQRFDFRVRVGIRLVVGIQAN